MNIQNNEILFLNKIKLGAVKDNEPASEPTTITVPEQDAEKGMKALSFLGAKNLMSNPGLAQQIEANNSPAFKRAPINNFTKVAAILTLATAGLASCMKQEQEANFDISSFIEAIESMKTDILAKFDKIIQQNDDMKEEMKAMRLLVQNMFSKIDLLTTKLDAGLLTMEQFKDEVVALIMENNETNDAILKQLEKNGKTEQEAKDYIKQLTQAYLDDRITLSQLMNEIADILTNIDGTLSMFYQQFIKAEERKAEHEKNVDARLANIKKYSKATTEDVAAIRVDQDSIIVQNNIQIAQLGELIKLNKQNNKIGEETKRILLMNGFTEAYIAQLVSKGVAGVEEANEKLQEISDSANATNEKLDSANAKLDAIYDELRHGNITEAQAAKQIIELLKSIDKKVDKIFDRLGSIESKIDKYGKEARQYYYQSHKDANALLKASYKNLAENKKQNARLDSLIVLENEKKVWVDSLVNQLDVDMKNGTNDVVQSLSKLDFDVIKGFGITNFNINMTAQSLKTQLLRWENNNHKDNIQIYEGEKQIIVLMEKYGPAISGGSNEGIIDAVERFRLQEKEADEAAAKQQEVDTAALLDAINKVKTEVSALGTKIDAVLSKMDTQISLLKTYGDKVSNALDENNELLKALKFETPDLTVLTNYVKELRDNSKTANTYLDIISKKQIAIGDQITNLEAIAGKQLTADELEVIWNQHDADNWAEAKAYFNAMGIDLKQFLQALHNEDMDKANEAIEYLKKGNKIAQDTYNLVAQWAERAKNQPNYTEILNKIYDYLPELICHCQCSGDVNKNEGIQGEIEDLLSQAVADANVKLYNMDPSTEEAKNLLAFRNDMLDAFKKIRGDADNTSYAFYDLIMNNNGMA